MSDDRRHAHRAFDPALLHGYLRGRKIGSVRLLPHGRSNSNYRLTVDGERCVLRLHSSGTAERERTAMRLVEGLVPLPAVLAAGADWTLLSFVEGKHLADRPEWVDAAARTMTRSWTIRFAERGWVNADRTVTPFDFGGETDFGTAMLRNEAVREWLGTEAIEALSAILGQLPADGRKDGCLVHGDYNPSNVLVRNGEVVAVLDWEFAHAGEPFMDIANLVRHTPPAYRERIREGIESSGMRLPDDWLRRCELEQLGSCLEFLTSGRADAFKSECANWIQAFIGRCRERG